MARLASRAHGVVGRAELLAAGVSSDQIRWRLGRGDLIVEFPGVYRVGHAAPSVLARYTAAVRACGPRAVLSGLAAAHLLELLKGRAPAPEVTSPRERRVPGIKTRRTRGELQRTVWRGIPVTSPARTLVDLAAVLDAETLARAVHEAGIRHHTTPDQVEAVLKQRRTSPGAAKLRSVLHGHTPVTLSRLESAFLAVLRAAGLPPPQTNRRAGSKRVDCRWPDHKLTVELDSYRYHRSRHAWEQDHQREREAYARDDQFRRYTHHDVIENPGPMLKELRELLTGRASPPDRHRPRRSRRRRWTATP